MVARARGNVAPVGIWFATFALAGVAIGTAGPSCAANALTAPAPSRTSARAAPQRVFATAQQAVDALIAANRADRIDLLSRILGPDSAKLLHSGDPVADRRDRALFVIRYEEAHRIELDGSNKAALIVGHDEWPLPVPLIRDRFGWRFDTQAGAQEILDRRVGRDELNVIEVCRAYVQAQREYAAIKAKAEGHAEYAQYLMSHAERHDGLYWPVVAGDKESPLGPLVAQARANSYAARPAGGTPRPYDGYFFRILIGQGVHASGGAKNYLISGHMIGGFGLIAYPARYSDSGIMTFIVNQNGIVFEKNLGTHTEALAQRIERYDPDQSWRIAR